MKARQMTAVIALPLLLAAGCAPYPMESPPEPLVPTPTTASYSELGTVRSIALVGNEVRRDRPVASAPVVTGEVYRIEVLTDRGDLRTFQYNELNGVQVGDRVPGGARTRPADSRMSIESTVATTMTVEQRLLSCAWLTRGWRGS